jgi:hypothetical protein
VRKISPPPGRGNKYKGNYNGKMKPALIGKKIGEEKIRRAINLLILKGQI